MTAAPHDTVIEREVFRQQAQMVRHVVGVSIAGLTHQDSLIQPHPGGNCLNWVMGHLLWAYQGVLELLGQEPPMKQETLGRYARGAAPMKDPAEAVDFDQLTKAWNESTERVDTGLASLSSEVLDRPAPNSPTGNPDETVRSLLATVFFHQAYHAGQTGLLRRLAGREGAIR